MGPIDSITLARNTSHSRLQLHQPIPNPVDPHIYAHPRDCIISTGETSTRTEASRTTTGEEIGNMLHVQINRQTSTVIDIVHLDIRIAMFELCTKIHASIYELRTQISETQELITTRLTLLDTTLAPVEDVVRYLGSQTLFVLFIYNYFIFAIDNILCFVNLN